MNLYQDMEFSPKHFLLFITNEVTEVTEIYKERRRYSNNSKAALLYVEVCCV